jgi:hypothetical protein
MLRSIGGVIVGWIVGFVIAFGGFLGLWFGFGVDGVLEKGQYKGTTVLNVGAPLLGLLGALAAGFVCAKISKSRTAVMVLAVILLIAGACDGMMSQARPTPGPRPEGQTVMEAIKNGKPPMWWSIANPLIGFSGVLLGGLTCCCQKKKD